MTSFYISLLRVFKKFIFLDGSIRNANLKIPFKIRLLNAINFFFSDRIISNSKAGLSAYGVHKKGEVIYNGIDVTKEKIPYNNATIKKTLNITTKYVVGMVATFNEKKDYKTFFRAAEILIEKRKDITFISVGEGPIYLQMKNQYAKKNSILFLGKKDDVFSFISIFDIGVLSTNGKIHSEGISNTIMEYMLMEKPVVATNGGGTNELLTDGKTGFLINSQIPVALAEKIDTLLNNRNKAQRMGRMGKERIIDKFSLSKMVDKYWIYYRKLSGSQ